MLLASNLQCWRDSEKWKGALFNNCVTTKHKNSYQRSPHLPVIWWEVISKSFLRMIEKKPLVLVLFAQHANNKIWHDPPNSMHHNVMLCNIFLQFSRSRMHFLSLDLDHLLASLKGPTDNFLSELAGQHTDLSSGCSWAICFLKSAKWIMQTSRQQHQPDKLRDIILFSGHKKHAMGALLQCLNVAFCATKAPALAPH